MNYQSTLCDATFTKILKNLNIKFVYKTAISLSEAWGSENMIIMFAVPYFYGDDQSLARLLVLLDYYAYVPFGKAGRDELNRQVQKIGLAKSAEEFCMNKILTAMEESRIEYDENFVEILKKFYEVKYGSKFNLSNPVENAAFIRRISGELENAMVEGKIVGFMRKSRELRETYRQLGSEALEKSEGVLNLEKDLPELIASMELSDPMKEHLMEVTNLSKIKTKE